MARSSSGVPWTCGPLNQFFAETAHQMATTMKNPMMIGPVKLKLLRWYTVNSSGVPAPKTVFPPGGQNGQNGGEKNRMVTNATQTTDVQPTALLHFPRLHSPGW